MRMNMIAAAVALASVSALHTPALAQNDGQADRKADLKVGLYHDGVAHNGRAQLRLTVVDEADSPVPNARVTIFTIYGPRTVKADQTGVVVVADLPAELTQWWARTGENLEGAEAAKLNAGENRQTLTLHRSEASS